MGIVKNHAAIGERYIRTDMPLFRLSNRLSIQRNDPQYETRENDRPFSVAAIGLAEIGNIGLLIDKAGYVVSSIVRFKHPTLCPRDGLELVPNEVFVRTADVIHVKDKREFGNGRQNDEQKQEVSRTKKSFRAHHRSPWLFDRPVAARPTH
jgi:hypothetical protein